MYLLNNIALCFQTGFSQLENIIYRPPFLDLNLSKSGGYTPPSTIENVFKLIGLIILCVLIIAASYFTTRFVGKRQLKTQAKSNFRSIDIYRINTNKYLQIIQAGKKYYLIAVTKDEISVIGEMKEDEIVNWPPEPKAQSFKEVMSSITKKKNGDKGKANSLEISHYSSLEAMEAGDADDDASEVNTDRLLENTDIIPEEKTEDNVSSDTK